MLLPMICKVFDKGKRYHLRILSKFEETR